MEREFMHISTAASRLRRFWIAALCPLTGRCQPDAERAGEFKLGDRTLRVPAGFTIEPVAGPPLVDRPITADFDEQGRLYVADSSGSNDKVQKQLAEQAAPDRPARGHRRRRPVRHADRLRRPDDVPRGDDVVSTARSTSRRRRASGS